MYVWEIVRVPYPLLLPPRAPPTLPPQYGILRYGAASLCLKVEGPERQRGLAPRGSVAETERVQLSHEAEQKLWDDLI